MWWNLRLLPTAPDCLSVIGLAREAAATFDAELHLHEPVVKGGAPGNLAELLDVETPAADLCPRYTARMVRNVKNRPPPNGCANASGAWACAPSTTSWTSPIMSCWNTVNPCTPLITVM